MAIIKLYWMIKGAWIALELVSQDVTEQRWGRILDFHVIFLLGGLRHDPSRDHVTRTLNVNSNGASLSETRVSSLMSHKLVKHKAPLLRPQLD